MDSINQINGTSPGKPQPNQPASQDAITTLENFIDHLVTAENNLTKAAEQSAIKNSEIQAEFEKRIALLSSRLEEAQSALITLEGSLAHQESTPTGSERLNSKKGEVAHWKSLLHEVCSPDQLDSGV